MSNNNKKVNEEETLEILAYSEGLENEAMPSENEEPKILDEKKDSDSKVKSYEVKHCLKFAFNC